MRDAWDIRDFAVKVDVGKYYCEAKYELYDIAREYGLEVLV